MNYILTVDLGTTAVKTIAFSMEGIAVLRLATPCRLIQENNFCAVQDAEEISNQVFQSMRDIIRQLGTPQAVSFSCAMHGILPVDKTGNPLSLLLTWADNRSLHEAESVKRNHLSGLIYKRTGTPIHPMSPLCKIKWIRNNQTELFSKTSKFLSLKEYIIFKLFGKYIVDYSIASATGLLDIYNLAWHHEALEMAGVSAEQLSDLVSPYTILKGMDKQYADFLGIDINTPFIIGAADGCLANLGSGATEAGQIAVTVGTSGAVRTITSSPILPDDFSLFSYILDEERYVSGGAVNNGGVVVDWMTSLFKMEDSESCFSEIEKGLASVTAGAEGLICLPYLLGERAPVYDSTASGVFLGVTTRHNQTHFYKALMEGICLNLYEIGENLIKNSSKPSKIISGGGLTQSKVFAAILADVFGLQVELHENHDHSSIGAFILACEALGLEFKKSDREKVFTIYPNEDNHHKYLKIYEVYRDIYKKHKEDFIKLNNLR